MTSFYLCEEAAAKRIARLVDRIASEAKGGILPISSDFWLLPTSMQNIIAQRISENDRS